MKKGNWLLKTGNSCERCANGEIEMYENGHFCGECGEIAKLSEGVNVRFNKERCGNGSVWTADLNKIYKCERDDFHHLGQRMVYLRGIRQPVGTYFLEKV